MAILCVVLGLMAGVGWGLYARERAYTRRVERWAKVESDSADLSLRLMRACCERLKLIEQAAAVRVPPSLDGLDEAS